MSSIGTPRITNGITSGAKKKNVWPLNWSAVRPPTRIVLAPTYTNEGNALVPFGIAALVLGVYGIFHPTAREARRAAVEAMNGLDHADEDVELEPPEFMVLVDNVDDSDDYEDEEPRPPRASSWPA
jgi:hypothetical protein